MTPASFKEKTVCFLLWALSTRVRQERAAAGISWVSSGAVTLPPRSSLRNALGAVGTSLVPHASLTFLMVSPPLLWAPCLSIWLHPGVLSCPSTWGPGGAFPRPPLPPPPPLSPPCAPPPAAHSPFRTTAFSPAPEQKEQEPAVRGHGVISTNVCDALPSVCSAPGARGRE